MRSVLLLFFLVQATCFIVHSYCPFVVSSPVDEIKGHDMIGHVTVTEACQGALALQFPGHATVGMDVVPFLTRLTEAFLPLRITYDQNDNKCPDVMGSYWTIYVPSLSNLTVSIHNLQWKWQTDPCVLVLVRLEPPFVFEEEEEHTQQETTPLVRGAAMALSALFFVAFLRVWYTIFGT